MLPNVGAHLRELRQRSPAYEVYISPCIYVQYIVIRGVFFTVRGEDNARADARLP